MKLSRDYGTDFTTLNCVQYRGSCFKIPLPYLSMICYKCLLLNLLKFGLIAVGNISEVKAEDNPPALLNDNKELQAVEQTLNGMEVDLEKKNLVNGNSQNETVSGAGGLGQGSPKVSSCDRALVRLCSGFF